ncbi:tail fiber protein [Aquimarina aquimarini]|uniref:tail fiber protein n=1 Tax=Aquimarina aquimarini TaxID=1191734 RepID=UPI000D55A3FD|nr:tail fiber protein [Aquimarina aquimarini]
MKKILLPLALFGIILGVQGQDQTINGVTFKTNGNVGIGTTQPLSLFHISSDLSGGSANNTIPNHGVLIGDNSTAGILNLGVDATGYFYSWLQSRDKTSSIYYNLALNPEGGNVGVGIRKPLSPLHISSGGNGGAANNYIPNQGIIVGGNDTAGILNLGIDANNLFHSWIQSRDKNSNLYYNLSLNPEGGNVGIGTTSPDMKLTVKGNIHAEEVLIDLNVPAPDYVFKKDYDLRSIEEVEKFIIENNHLPEIPSAKEFEQNGVMQAEMDMNLLKKVEELTLYIIVQEKKIKKLESLNQKLVELQSRLEKLESKKLKILS